MAMVPHEPCNPTRGASLLLSFLGAKVASMLKHGHSRDSGESPTYRSWIAMIQRCYDEDATSYDRYGARGITVCDRWRFGADGMSGFECFLADVGERPSLEHSIDRIENELNYDPDNCKWSTVKEQNRNRRSTRWVEFMGRTMSLAEAVELSGLPEARVKRRLYVYKWTVDEALAAR
jgi:hypothetical protein